MKKIFLFIASFAVISCANDPKPDPIDYTILSGKIENSKKGKILVFNDNFKKEITLNKDDGTFLDTLRVQTGYYTLMHDKDKATLFLTKEKDVKLTTNATKFIDRMKFEGKGAAENNFLLAKTTRNKSRDAIAIFSMEEPEFIKTINGFGEITTKLLTEATDLDEEFIAYEKKNIKYANLINLSKYPMYYPHYSKNEDYKPSETFNAYFENVDYDNEEDFNVYKNFKELAIRHYSEKLNPFENIKGAIDTLKALKSQSLKNVLAQNLSFFISPSGKDSDYLYKELSTISKDDEFKKELTEKYNTIKKLVAGNASPKFNYENHKGGKTTLEDLKGKYVYIDVWATWCGPCIKEIPSLKKVEKKYHNKNIEFVSISIDDKDDHAAWKKMVDDKDLGGIQLMADNDWKSQFVTEYAIEGIPRFILIDPNGNIVNADAPRPSSPELIELFDELKI
ncbi:TlpA disulfide reductase family protein [uncultured Kordia sp.]|uniref:TlpA family protein disulfide reductase n=1 Tax=uncultured Kordia sp. TaxID=507699 RepID=UPI002638A7EC|nr:TlpA disulfide reductase family protein [uncultured Kordia sp.]